MTKGFHSSDNQIALKKYFEKVLISKKGKLSKLDKARESDAAFRKMRRQYSAVESEINALEVHGLDICLDHGIKGLKRYVALAVLARNIHRFGELLRH